MRYIIYSFCYETPHLETDLEIANKILDQGHEVFFLTCNSVLKTCFLNPCHNKIICNVCKSKISNGIKHLNIDNDHILSISSDYELELPSINEIKSFDDLNNYKYKDCDIGSGVVSSLVSITRDHLFDLESHKELVISGLETSALIYEDFSSVIKKYKPDVVVLFNGRFLESKPVLHLCHMHNIKFYTHERGGQLDRFMFRENSTPHSLDYGKTEIDLLWNNSKEDKYFIGKKFYEERRNKIIQNWHVYNKNQILGKLPENFDKSKKNIAIFNSSIDEYVTIPDFKNKIYKDDNDGIKQLFEFFKNDLKVHFYLRNHPNLNNLNTTQTRQINTFKSEYHNITIIDASEVIDSYALMESVDIVVTFGSTMGIEALYWGTPSVLLGRAYYEDIPGILKPKSHYEACILLKEKLNKNTYNSKEAIKYGYWSLMYGIPYEYFKPKSLFKGYFKDKKIKASSFHRVLLKLHTLYFQYIKN
jgi:hypothetical protein